MANCTFGARCKNSTEALYAALPTMENQIWCFENVLSVNGDTARELVRSGYRYLDVRMAEDFDTGHVEGAMNVPYYSSVTPAGRVKNPQFMEQVSALFGKDERLIVGCRTGMRSRRATADLLNAGFKVVKNMGGGYVAWEQSKVSVEEHPFVAAVSDSTVAAEEPNA